MEHKSIIFGIRAIIEAINAEKSIDKIFIQKNLQGDLFKELELLYKKQGINVSIVPPEKLNRLSKGMNHQGAVAQISPVVFYDIDNLIQQSLNTTRTPLFLLLDQISDVRNFGAIVRTAECTGVSGIIIQKKGGAPIHADSVKTSAGAIFKIPICKVDHIKDAVYHLQASGIKVIAATEKTQSLVYDVLLTEPVAIIMGSEDKGINPSVLKIVDAKAKVPILGKIDSLNVSVACGVFLYEALRQRMG